MTTILGVDIGGTKIAGLLVDGHHRPLAQATLPTPSTDPVALYRAVVALIGDMLARANLTLADLTAVGVGVPGQVNSASGTVTNAVNLNLDHYPLGSTLAAELSVPVIVENDVRAAAVGAYQRLFPTGAARSVAYLNLGTGVAAGVVLNGQLYRGRRGMAGEIGHMVVDPDGEWCNCGQRGCLETVIAGPAMARHAQAALPESDVLSPADLYRTAATDSGAAAAVARVTQGVALAVQWLLMTYDIDQIVLGGGVTRVGAPFIQPVLAYLDAMRETSPLLQTLYSADLVVLPADFNAGVWGVIHLAREAMPTPTNFQR
jgi:predicted NBD/HSP70 family sugar kinase